AVLAPIIANVIHPISVHSGKRSRTTTEANTAPIKAKGRANKVCSNLIISKNIFSFLIIYLRFLSPRYAKLQFRQTMDMPSYSASLFVDKWLTVVYDLETLLMIEVTTYTAHIV